MNSLINSIVSEFSHQNGVISIVLGGSRASNSNDSTSDYDIYIYTNSELSPGIRDSILTPLSTKLELNNKFWEPEDNLLLKDGSYCDLIYRDISWFEGELNRVLNDHIASTGYTTCLWYNLLNSKIMYDSRDYYKRIQSKFNIEYPKELADGIISKNLPLITESIPSYLNQIEKAVSRGDTISINHRVSGYFGSYFDILYAINRLPHPGEKRLIDTSLKLCKKIPVNFKSYIEECLKSPPKKLVERLRLLSKELTLLL